MDKHRGTYVIIFFPGLRKAACLNRAYTYIGDNISLWGKISMGDIVQVEDNVVYDQFPAWVFEAIKDGHRHVTLWTKYFDSEMDRYDGVKNKEYPADDR